MWSNEPGCLASRPGMSARPQAWPPAQRPFNPPITGPLSGLVLRDDVVAGHVTRRAALRRVRWTIPLRTPTGITYY